MTNTKRSNVVFENIFKTFLKFTYQIFTTLQFSIKQLL